MGNGLKIKLGDSIDEHVDELSEFLIEVVEDGASLGFLPLLSRSAAAEYWSDVLNSDVYLFIAKLNNRIIGSVQVQLCTKQNGRHRAEISKLMIHSRYRRKGIGRLLMHWAEECAKLEGRSLLVLDTREGDPSNALYSSIGYIQAGKIPCYAKSANGVLDATILYYKIIY